MSPKYRKFFSNESTLFCFTPLISLITFIIEFFMAGYVLYRYGLTKFTRIAVLLLVLLGVFQLAEYMICKGGDPQLWSKIGTASITLLPVMALHLITMITRKSRWTQVGYIFGALIIGAIVFMQVPILPQCTGKFVILWFDDLFSYVFYIYYAAFVFMGVEMIIRTWRTHKGSNTKLFWAMMIYLSFIIPTTLVYIFISFARAGMPSIMCGFAVIGAIILVFKELPLLYRAKRRK